MSDRGMKKWAPYKALVEQTPAIDHTFEGKKKVDRPIISQDVAEQINEVLVNYNGQEVKIKYWKRGVIYEEVTIIKTLDVMNKKIVIAGGTTIFFADLLYLENY